MICWPDALPERGLFLAITVALAKKITTRCGHAPATALKFKSQNQTLKVPYMPTSSHLCHPGGIDHMPTSGCLVLGMYAHIQASMPTCGNA
jgi:hypothetical protein